MRRSGPQETALRVAGCIAAVLIAVGVYEAGVGGEPREAKQQGVDGSQSSAQRLLKVDKGLSPDVKFVLRWHAGEPIKRVLAQRADLPKAAREDPFGRLAYAQMCQAAGDRGTAMEELEALVRLYPKNANLLYLMGRYHFEAGGEEEGRRCLEAALEVDPFHSPSALELANYLRDWKKDRAMELVRSVLAIEKPGSPLAQRAIILLEKLTASSSNDQSRRRT
jgi:tetratricopeptide (TPR) repeat protein